MTKKKTERLSIDEIEQILKREDEEPLEILPNGEIRRGGRPIRAGEKPLTMRENLGGEYSL
jgi:hypothetical protein